MMFSGAAPMVAPINSQAPAMMIRTEGNDAFCGLPCFPCCYGTIQFQKQYFIPPETGGRITQQELDQLMEEGNRVLKNSHIPPFPLIFTHFCIPFSPICILACYASKREKDLRSLCEKWNNQVFLQRGCHMELVTTMMGYGRHSTKDIALHLVIHPNQGGYGQPQSVPVAYASAPQGIPGQPQQAYGQQQQAMAYGQPQQAMPYGQQPYGQQQGIQMAPVTAVAYAPAAQKMDF